VTQVVTTLLQDFFDQNPISQVALVELRDGKAEKITELSGNARHHKSKLEERLNQWNGCGKGAASLRSVSHSVVIALRAIVKLCFVMGLQVWP
jgi:hypothetical protein